MNIGEPQYNKGLVKLPLDNGRSLEATPQEFWRLIEKVSSYLIENYDKFESGPVKAVQKLNKSFLVSVTSNIHFWESVEEGGWEPETFEILDRFLSKDCIYLDIGSWIGPTALYGAQLAKQTHAFEPDPIAYRELELNVCANKNTEWIPRLSIYNKAIASSSGTIEFGSRDSGGDSTSSILFKDGKTRWEVKAITLQQFMEDEKLQDEKLFIKIDIEGGEYELIPSLKKYFVHREVNLFLSIHTDFLMESLVRGKKTSPLQKILQRLVFVGHHIKLIRSLPFKYFYHTNGHQVNYYKQLLKAILTAGFVSEIVATNSKWDSA